MKCETMNHSLIREQFRQQREGTDTHFFIPKSVTFRACMEPLANLKPTCIVELRTENPAKGFYLLLKTVDKSIVRSGIMLLVEDLNGEVAICFLYDHVYVEDMCTVEEILPIGTVFVLKQPCLTASTGTNLVIVVGSPSDFVIVDLKHVLFGEAKALGCKETSENESSSPEPKTTVGWRSSGNEFFKSARYDDAIKAYLIALDMCDDEDSKLVLYLNLSAVYLTTGYYERTVNYTSKVLQHEPHNEKALFRMARAEYELRNFLEAERIFAELVLLHPTNKNARLELSRCRERLQESRGFVNVYRLYMANLTTPNCSLDFGQYVGNVSVVPVSGKGRGVIANCQIKAGTLILAEKALVANLSDDSKGGAGAGVLTKLVIQALFKNPVMVGDVLYDMTSNNEEWDKQKHIVCDDTKPLVQYDRLLQIVNMNSFSLTSEYEGVTALSCRRALFPFASFFNHSCTCNSSFEVFNDVITIRSLVDISEGEEITISYVSNIANFSKRETLLRSYGFDCSCAVCEIDRKELPEIHDQREDLLTEMKELFISSSITTCSDKMSMYDMSGESKLSKIVTRMKKTYLNRKDYRVHLFRLYLLFAQVIERQGQEYRLEFLKTIDSGLQCVELSAKALFRSSSDEVMSLPKNALICKLLFQYASVCARAELSYGHPDQVNRWVKVLLMLERIFTGGDVNYLRDRFRGSRLMSLILENAVM